MQTNRDIALVTGASRGIGLATARLLAEAGYDVAFTARTRTPGTGRVPPRTTWERVEGTGRPGEESIAVPGSLAETVAVVEAAGVRALPIEMDLSSTASVAAAAEELLSTWGAPAVVVNNAIRHVPHARFAELRASDLRDSFEANVVAQVELLQRLVPAMAEAGGGTVVDICSGSAAIDPPAPPGEGGWGLGYAAAKAAFGRIAGALNAEYRAAGVLAYNLEPGFVVTESGAARGGTDAIEARGFAGEPVEACGEVITWLASLRPDDPRVPELLGRVLNAPELSRRISRPAAGPLPG